MQGRSDILDKEIKVAWRMNKFSQKEAVALLQRKIANFALLCLKTSSSLYTEEVLSLSTEIRHRLVA